MGYGRTAMRAVVVIALFTAGAAQRRAGAEPASAEPAFGPVAPRADARRVPLHWASAGSLALPPRVLSLSDTAPTGARPPLHADGARYAVVPLGAATLGIAVELRAGSERVWLDLDLDGDLGDDDRAWWQRTASGWSRTEHVLVPFVEGAERAYVAIVLRREHDVLTIEHGLCRRGTTELGGRLRDIALLDGDHDARFDGPADVWVVDLDGDGVLDLDHERVVPRRPFRVGDEGWIAASAPASGAFLALERVRPGTTPPPRNRAWQDVPPPPTGVLTTPPDAALDELLAQLRARPSPSVTVRRDLVERIGRVGSDEAFQALDDLAVTDRILTVRWAATRAMGNALYRDAHAADVARMTDISKFGDAARGVAAIEALHAMGWDGREELYRRLLAERGWLMMGAAARHLAYLPSAGARALATDACTSLTLRSTKSKPWHDRLEAYRGVRTIPGGPDPALMVGMAEANHPALLALALRDLRTIGHARTRELARRASRFTSLVWNPVDTPQDLSELAPYTRGFVEGRRDLGAELIRSLGSGDDPESMEGLLLLAEGIPLEHRDALIKQLAARRTRASVEGVMPGLSAHSRARRQIAAAALGRIPGAHVTAALIERLDAERHEPVEVVLYEALRHRRDESAVDALLSRCTDGPLRGYALRAAAACAPREPRVRRVIQDQMRSDDWEQRVRGVLAARDSADPQLALAVAKLLDDPRWSVRVAAVETLRSARQRDAVAPLIARLEREDRLRLQLAIADALFELTGLDLGADAGPWEAWFGENGDTFVVPNPTPIRRRAVESTTAAFFGLPIDSDHVTFVLDRSGSMRSMMDAPSTLSRLHASMDETTGAVDSMPDGAFVNLVLFHMNTQTWKNRLVPLTAKSRKAFRQRARSGLMGPQTDVFRALRTALRDADADTILLLTDGLPNTGDHVEPASLLQAIARLNETSQVAIHCVSIGTDSELLERLAAANAGRYIRR